MNERQDYYVPKTIEEKKSGMELEGVSAEMMSMADSSGMIKVTLENDVTIEKIARDLYKDPKAGIRELVNNEARPCRNAIKNGHDAMIYITINGETRTVVIEGRGTMGMTMKTFKDVFTVLGRSGNFDGDESGQFGFGRASYLCLSDIMVFETYSRETNERFGFLGKGGKVYEPIPEHMLSIKEHGTKVSLSVREGIDMLELVKYTEEVSRFLGVPVMLDVPNDIVEYSTWGSERKHERSLTQIGPVSAKEYLSDEGKQPHFIEIDNDDYSLVGSLSYGSARSVKCLIGIPIEMDNFPFDGFEAYVLNIKNERKFMPTASRDSMSADSAARLNAKITHDLKEHFSTITIDSVSDCVDNGKKTYSGLSSHFIEAWGFDQSVVDFADLQRCRFKFATASSGLPERGRYHDKIGVVGAYEKYENVFYLHSVNRMKVTEFLKKEPKSIILFTNGTPAEKKETGASLEKFGIHKLTDYMRKNKIKVTADASTEVVVHSGASGHTEHRRIGALTDRCIRLPANVSLTESLRSIRDSCFNDFWFVKDSKMFAGTGSVTLDSVCNKALRKKYATSSGPMTGRQILKKYKTGIVVLELKFKERFSLTAEKCREITNADLVIVEDKVGHAKVSDITKLQLACRVKYPNRHFTYGYENRDYFTPASSNKFNDVILDNLTKGELGIEVDGSWQNDPIEAVKYIGQIKSIPVRNLYALAYNKMFRWGDGWTDNNSKKELNALHKKMLKIDETAGDKSLMELCQELINAKISSNQDGAHMLDGDDVYAKIALKQIIEEFSKNDKKVDYYDPNDVDLLANVLNTVMGTVISGNIKVARTDRSKSSMKIIIDAQPISILPECLLMKIVNNMPVDHEFVGMANTADGKIELHI